MEDSKPVTTPGSRDETAKASYVIVNEKDEAVNDTEDPKAGEMLNKEDTSRFRGMAARANFLSQDRADIKFATKEISRRMAKSD